LLPPSHLEIVDYWWQLEHATIWILTLNALLDSHFVLFTLYFLILKTINTHAKLLIKNLHIIHHQLILLPLALQGRQCRKIMMFAPVIPGLYHKVHPHCLFAPVLKNGWDLYHRHFTTLIATNLLALAIVGRFWEVIFSKNLEFLCILFVFFDFLLQVVVMIDDERLEMGRLQAVVPIDSLCYSRALIRWIFFLLWKALNFHQTVIKSLLQLLGLSETLELGKCV
jgi:hypothetical protein